MSMINKIVIRIVLQLIVEVKESVNRFMVRILDVTVIQIIFTIVRHKNVCLALKHVVAEKDVVLRKVD